MSKYCGKHIIVHRSGLWRRSTVGYRQFFNSTRLTKNGLLLVSESSLCCILCCVGKYRSNQIIVTIAFVWIHCCCVKWLLVNYLNVGIDYKAQRKGHTGVARIQTMLYSLCMRAKNIIVCIQWGWFFLSALVLFGHEIVFWAGLTVDLFVYLQPKASSWAIHFHKASSNLVPLCTT